MCLLWSHSPGLDPAILHRPLSSKACVYSLLLAFPAPSCDVCKFARYIATTFHSLFSHTLLAQLVQHFIRSCRDLVSEASTFTLSSVVYYTYNFSCNTHIMGVHYMSLPYSVHPQAESVVKAMRSLQKPHYYLLSRDDAHALTLGQKAGVS